MTKPIGTPDPTPPVGCPRCGQEHPRCTGHVTRNATLKPCGRWPTRGARVCSTHGASAPQVKAAAARRLENEKLSDAMRRLGPTYGIAPDRIDHDVAILEMFANTAGHVAYLLACIRELEPDALVWGKTSEVVKGAGEFPGTDTTYAAAAHVLVATYDRERRLLLEIYKTIKGTRLEEQRLDLAKAQVAPQIAVVWGKTLAALSLSPEQQALVPGLMRAAIQEFLGGGRVIEGSVHSG